MTERQDVAVGWDIGGVNVKAARVPLRRASAREAGTVVLPFEIWRAPERLGEVLEAAADRLGLAGDEPAAITMTAELSDAFPTRREGVRGILRALGAAFPRAPLAVVGIDGELASVTDALTHPLDFAATNWVASALYVAAHVPACVLVDVGSTTTDIVPVAGGRILAQGRTDAERLARGELVYTGVLRTNPATFVERVPLRGRLTRVAAEWFTQTADVYLLLGRIGAGEYTCPTPDGRTVSRAAAHARLARLVCEDVESLTAPEAEALAAYLAEAQVRQVADGLAEVLSGLPPEHAASPVVAVGAGAFVAVEAARRVGLPVFDGAAVGVPALAAFPAAAAAALLVEDLRRR